MRAIAHLLRRPRRLTERCESIVIAFDDGRPCIDQRVVPVEQDGARWLPALRPGHVTPSVALAMRASSAPWAPAVGANVPSPTGGTAIVTPVVKNAVALVMKAS